MLEHTFETKIYYFDTDSYGIVWHGSYVKWCEMGRVDFFTLLGTTLKALNEKNIQFPVVNLNIRYKSPSYFSDILETTTTIDEVTKFTIKFKHEIYNKTQEKMAVIGFSEVAVTTLEGKLYKPMPSFLSDMLTNSVEKSEKPGKR